MAEHHWTYYFDKSQYWQLVSELGELIEIGELSQASRILNRAVSHVYPVRNRKDAKIAIMSDAIVIAPKISGDVFA